MEQTHEQPMVSADNSKLPPAEELLDKALEKSTYELPTEAFLNPQNMDHISEPDSENVIEGFSVSTQYQNMIGDIVMDKVLRPNMTDAEINAVAAAMIAEYEAPITEEIAQEEDSFMEQATAGNQKEIVASNEQKLSPLSRAIELMSGWLSKHPTWTKTAMGAVVASELAGCATGGGYYRGPSYTAQRMVSTGLHGVGQVVQNEMYGRQNAEIGASFSAENARASYEYAMTEENTHYRQSLTELDFYTQDQGGQIETQETYQQHQLSHQALKEEQRQKLEHLHRQFNSALEHGDTVTSAQIRRQIESEENKFIQEQRDFIERNMPSAANGVVNQRYNRNRAQIESRHQRAIANIQARFQHQMRNTQSRYAHQMQNTDMRTQQIQLNTGLHLFNQAIHGLMYGR
jgi:hypothetical protein